MAPRPPIRLRATFTSCLRYPFIVLHDHSGRTSGRPVTQDARAVVGWCLSEYGPFRIICRSPDGAWNELRHDGEEFLDISRLAPDFMARVIDAWVPE